MAIQATRNSGILMKRILKKLIEWFYAPFVLQYLKQDRFYTYQGIKIKVKKDVFHPGFFFSTKHLISFLSQLDIKDKKVLELGAGSGLISFYCYTKGAHVTATDINSIAIEALKENSNRLQMPIHIIESNLFDCIPKQIFDYILINPPYYPKTPINIAEHAWYCGAGFEYFVKLFTQLKSYIDADSAVLMTLSEDCNIHKITTLANEGGFDLILQKKQRLLWEMNFIYKIQPIKK